MLAKLNYRPALAVLNLKTDCSEVEERLEEVFESGVLSAGAIRLFCADYVEDEIAILEEFFADVDFQPYFASIRRYANGNISAAEIEETYEQVEDLLLLYNDLYDQTENTSSLMLAACELLCALHFCTYPDSFEPLGVLMRIANAREILQSAASLERNRQEGSEFDRKQKYHCFQRRLAELIMEINPRDL